MARTLVRPGIGLRQTGDVVDLQRANENAEIGGVITALRSDTQGLEFDTATGLLTAPLATELLAGAILEPLPDGLHYVRTRTAAGVSSWERSVGPRIAGTAPDEVGVVYVVPARGLGLNPDGGLTLAPTTPSQVGGIIDAPFSDPADPKSYVRQNAAWVEAAEAKPVRIAGTTPAEAGIVYVVPKLGISLNPDGGLAIAPSTPTQVGGLFDAPWDTKAYVRQNAAWVESSAATQKLYGVGLIESLDKTRVDLKIAGLNDEIGGVRTFARGPTNGLEFDNQTGVISVPLATDRLPGAMVEPDGAMGGQFARTWDGTTGAWTPIAAAGVAVSDTPPATPTPNQLWFESDTSSLFLRYEDADSSQWIQVNVAAPPNTGVEEAPTDGQQYARQSNAWSVVTGGGTPLDAYTKTESDARYLLLTGGTVTGAVTINGTTTFDGATSVTLNYAGGINNWQQTFGSRFDLTGPSNNIWQIDGISSVVNFAQAPTVAGAPIVLATKVDALEADLLGHITRLMERIEALEGAR